MNMGTSTSFAEQEAAAMEKNREAFMALWNEYVKGRKGDKAVLHYLEEAGFFTSPASTKYHGAFPGGLCYHSVNVATEVLGIMAQHQLEDENMNASAVTCALLHEPQSASAAPTESGRTRPPMSTTTAAYRWATAKKACSCCNAWAWN